VNIICKCFLAASITLVGLSSQSAEVKNRTADQRNQLDTVAVIKRFLHATYPRLAEVDVPYLLTVRDDYFHRQKPPEEVRFFVEEFCRPPDYHKGTEKQGVANQRQVCSFYYPGRRPLFDAIVRITPSGKIDSYAGGFVEDNKKLEALKYDIDQRIKKQEHIDDVMIDGFLHSAGARYTPDNRAGFMQALNKQDLSLFFGKYRVRSVDFELRYTLEDSDFKPLLMEWRVQVEVPNLGRHPETYFLYYEPFEGTLSRMEPGDAHGKPRPSSL